MLNDSMDSGTYVVPLTRWLSGCFRVLLRGLMSSALDLNSTLKGYSNQIQDPNGI